MKQRFLIKNMLPLIAIISLLSCRKDIAISSTQINNSNHLVFSFYPENKIRINQMIEVYDSTAIKDSIEFVIPTPGKYYKWEVIPHSLCDSVTGDKGIARFIFHCSGSYKITAKIYDSLSQELLGSTDTLQVNVTTDTLYQIQKIQDDDVLNMQTSISRYSLNGMPEKYFISIYLTSTKNYNGHPMYLEFENISNVTTNYYSYTFSGVKLTSYPISFGPYNSSYKVSNYINLQNLSYGVPANLSITWLGVTYNGTITFVDKDHYIFNWDNSGAVKMK